MYSFHILMQNAVNSLSGGTAVIAEMTRTGPAITASEKTKLRGFIPKANYTDRATAAYRRS
jgi:hypothetical protein